MVIDAGLLDRYGKILALGNNNDGVVLAMGSIIILHARLL